MLKYLVDNPAVMVALLMALSAVLILTGLLIAERMGKGAEYRQTVTQVMKSATVIAEALLRPGGENDKQLIQDQALLLAKNTPLKNTTAVQLLEAVPKLDSSRGAAAAATQLLRTSDGKKFQRNVRNSVKRALGNLF